MTLVSPFIVRQSRPIVVFIERSAVCAPHEFVFVLPCDVVRTTRDFGFALGANLSYIPPSACFAPDEALCTPVVCAGTLPGRRRSPEGTLDLEKLRFPFDTPGTDTARCAEFSGLLSPLINAC